MTTEEPLKKRRLERTLSFTDRVRGMFTSKKRSARLADDQACRDAYRAVQASDVDISLDGAAQIDDAHAAMLRDVLRRVYHAMQDGTPGLYAMLAATLYTRGGTLARDEAYSLRIEFAAPPDRRAFPRVSCKRMWASNGLGELDDVLDVSLEASDAGEHPHARRLVVVVHLQPWEA